jgi:hypothetical protein
MSDICEQIAATVPRERIAEILEGAAERLDLCSWGQGNARQGMRQICGEDSIYFSIVGKSDVTDVAGFTILQAGETILVHKEYMATSDYLRYEYLNGQPVWKWNDEPGRTKDEVIDLFRNAAKDIRNAS